MLVVSSDEFTHHPPFVVGIKYQFIYHIKMFYFHHENISDIMQPASILAVPE
jgi:hypothetical protein